MIKRTLVKLSALPALCFAGMALADGKAISVGDIAQNVQSSATGFAQIAGTLALVVGIFLILGGFLKLHQHHKNSQQVRATEGVVLLAIGAGLMLFPMLMNTATKSVFGDKGSISKVDGSDVATLIGGTAVKPGS